MASNIKGGVDTCSVQGKLFDNVTRQGIEHLLVTVYDVARGRDGAGLATPAPLAEWLKGATRIGSVLSDASGQFRFTYDNDDLSQLGAGRKRLDLLVVVSAPEDGTSAAASKVFYYTNPPRLNAGRVENFSIGITRDTQAKFGLDDDVDIRESIGTYKRRRTDEKALNQGIVDFHRAAIQKDVKEKAGLRTRLLDSLTTRAAAIATTGALVRDGEDIKEKVSLVGSRAVTRANAQINDERGVQVNLYLTPADRTRLQPFFDDAVDGMAEIPEHALRDILFRTNSSENPGTLLVHSNPFAQACAAQSFEEKCARFHTGIGGEHDEDHSGADPGPVPGPGVDTITNADIPTFVAKLVTTVPSPDGVLSPEFNDQRADREAVENAVEAFSLRKGPAEVPAFYDFHSLQIAFEHVWKVLVDEEIVDKTHALETKYRAKTGVTLLDRFPHAWPNLVNVTTVYESIPQEVPAEVAAQFDVTIEEWTDLSAAHQKKVVEIAKAIASACNPERVGGGFLGDRYRTPANCEKKKQDLREQGDRIIDAVRHDDYHTLHKTLRDLNDRINSNYEFTVFAADRNFHSVNFGLLNTYRQQWTPINYQAGKLVKTIPLAPKEERKYSVKSMRTDKQARRQAQKNNASLKNEQSSTSRVEAEIIEKAHTKTNFGLTAEGNYNIGISKGKSTTTFGVEAQSESAATRKDFREAVLKAVQEYSEENNVQVDTETTASDEYTESGMLANQNEEISATFLLYQLQRRYRVSEQLHRAAPVVLVAQEVPAPHEITESWVIANDWVFNRCLLDDSFRPALQYLANKSVGDDFALRELRKNLRQQRNLVETLRIELVIAGGEAENRYRSLEKAIENRIGEEEAEETDGWFSDVGDFFGGDGQSPESAKARELAAKDAHQYAVEKAEKAGAALRSEVENLHRLTREYNATLRDHLDNETRCKRLMVHIRNNIFYYMQAIWSMEPPDQRFLRLHKVEVPRLELARVPDPEHPDRTLPDRRYRVEVAAIDDIFADFREPGTSKHRAFMTGTMQPVTRYTPLVEVADLDNLLGFKGNYMIFPMKQHNALTEFMAAPYVDAAFGAMDPDELSNVNLEDYNRYVCCLHEKMTPGEFDAIKPGLRKWLELLLADPLRNGDEIVVPTGSLFIEVLAGTHPLLENFKLRHRELDVYRVQADVRKAELENLRLAARLLNDEREDPQIDKRVLIEGHAAVVVDPA